MTERKVLNKYYPPDYDYRRIPRLKRERNAQWVQRVMAPFNMRCNTCGHYIYRGTKFNARRETAMGETYLGLKIFRFYIRCPMCCGDISFKTDIENLDYAIETGATRNFEAAKLIAAEDKRKQEEVAAEEANNPMAVLENRTRDSRREMEIMENLEELKERADSNATTDLNDLIGNSLAKQQQLLSQILLKQEEDDEAFISSLYEQTSDGTRIKRINTSIYEAEVDLDDCDALPNLLSAPSCSKASTDILSADDEEPSCKVIKKDSKQSSKTSKSSLSGLVKVKTKKTDASIKVTPSCKLDNVANHTKPCKISVKQVEFSQIDKELDKSDARLKPETDVKDVESKESFEANDESDSKAITDGKVAAKPACTLLQISSSSEIPSSAAPSSLLSLGAYSDSSNSDDGDG